MKPFTVELDTTVVPPVQAKDVMEMPTALVPSYPIDASTGIPVSRITSGSCPENNVGDFTPPKATLVTNPGQRRGDDE